MSTVLIALLGFTSPSRIAAQTFTTLHGFAILANSAATNLDGASPAGDLLLAGNRLYGTTSHGGAFGAGTIFAVNIDGSGFTNLHSFSALSGPVSTNRDGAQPLAALVISGNTLFGTARTGGDFGNGTIFKIQIDGSGFTTLHSFTAVSGLLFANADGAHPQAALILLGNSLYGTAPDGGTYGNGTVFAINTSGTEFGSLYSFSSAYFSPWGGYTNLDGVNPFAGLAFSGSMLFGTTVYGGTAGQGTVFGLDIGQLIFTNLHNFTLPGLDSSRNRTNGDGANPASALTLSGDILYGTAQNGGRYGTGTAFSLAIDGSGMRILHHFNPSVDGANPLCGLAFLGQGLYGTTSFGGAFGTGALFMFNTNGTAFTNLYSFTTLESLTNRDGANPVTALVSSGSALYGTTYFGGPSGSGSLFVYAPATSAALSLNISRFGQDVVLSWPVDAIGYRLQSTTNVNPLLFWTNASAGPVVVNGQNTMTNPMSGTQTFFRLSR